MMQLLYDYCEQIQLSSVDLRPYQINERVSFEYWLKTLREINAKHPISGLGIEIGGVVQPSHVGVLAYIAQNTANLAQFFSMSKHYINLWYHYTELHFEYQKDQAIIWWEQPSYVKSGLYVYETAISKEIMVSILWHLLIQLVGESNVHFNWIEFTSSKPLNTEPYHLFHCPVKFDAEFTRICLPRRLLELPMRRPDSILREILESHAEQSLNTLPQEDSFIEKVNHHILEALEQQCAFIEPIAEKMNMSARQLQKLLKGQGLSFQQCLNTIRLELAKKHLRDEVYSITEIAYMLSYNQTASFNRAFKSWTGLNPSQWRHQTQNAKKQLIYEI